MDQKTAVYRLDCKSKYHFYLRMSFDLIHVVFANGHIAYTKLGKGISLLNIKIVVAKTYIGRYSNRKKLFPTSRLIKQKSHEPSMPREVPTCMPEFQEKPVRWHYCKNEDSNHNNFSSCQTCDLYLFLSKE